MKIDLRIDFGDGPRRITSKEFAETVEWALGSGLLDGNQLADMIAEEIVRDIRVKPKDS